MGSRGLDATLAADDASIGETAAPASGDTLAASVSDHDSMRSVRPPVADEPSELPKRIGRFHVLRRLGTGGMGVVFAGFDVELDRKVAIKLLLTDSHEGSVGHTRIMREAQAMARLSHPNVVPIYEVGVHARQVFLAMEFVQGQTLAAWLAEHPRAWREILAMYLQAARGLAAAHAAGIVHRDFKPDNALVGADGRLRVLDFGLAARGRRDEQPAVAASSGEPAMLISALDQSVTRVGAVMGTPAYMSPEQAAGAPIDARSDQFSYCVALWEALYGERPFVGESFAELCLRLGEGIPRPPSRHSAAPRWLHRALLRGLRSDPGGRWPAMDALIDELTLGPGRTPRRLGVAGGLALASALAVGVAWPGEPAPEPCTGGPARLAGVWDDALRAASEQAARASGLPYADEVWTRTSLAIDAYAARWLAGYRDACHAHERGEQSDALLDLRMRCLDDRREQLAAASALLRDADAKTIERAPQIAAALDAIETCSDGQALAAAVPPPSDPAVRAAVDVVRRTLARSRAVESAGRYKDALALAQEAVAAAAPLKYRPSLAEAEARLGRVLNRTGQFTDAAAHLADAYYLALESGHDEIARDAAIRLVRLHGDRLDDDAQARRWRRDAEAFVARAGADSPAAAPLLNSVGILEVKHGRFEEARAAFERAVALREREKDGNPDDLAEVLSSLGATLEALGRYEEAEARLAAALEIRERVFGPDHPNTAMTRGNLANVHAGRGEWDRARIANERTLAVFERAYGPEHVNTAMVYANLGKSLAALGDRSAGRRHAQALAGFLAAFSPTHPLVVEQRIEYAAWLIKQGDRTAARAQAELAVPFLAKVTAGREIAKLHRELAEALADEPTARATARAFGESARSQFVAAGAVADAAAMTAWLAAHP
jgi:tetratricopeptide (TPR) repeat protein/predicted Ser/Thr protein kinase